MAMKQGDTGTQLRFNLKRRDTGVAINLDNAEHVYLITKLRGTRAEHLCNVVNSVSGTVSYTLQEGDLFASGLMYMEARVEFLDGSHYTTNRVERDISPVL